VARKEFVNGNTEEKEIKWDKREKKRIYRYKKYSWMH
jgi:hypothetical protein